MRFIEIFCIVFMTLILVAFVLPVPCIPPSCGPPDAAPFTMGQIILVYLRQPLTWEIIVMWLFAAVIWWRRAAKARRDEN